MDDFKADEIRDIIKRAIASGAYVDILYVKNGEANEKVFERSVEPTAIKINKKGEEYVATIQIDKDGKEQYRSFSLDNIHMAIDY